MRFSIALVSGLMSAATFCVPAHAIELITNGSFENGFTGWNATGAVEPIVGQGAHDGLAAAMFNYANAAPSGVLSQAIATTPGVKYRICFEYWGWGRAVVQKLGIQVTGNATLVSRKLSAIGSSEPVEYHTFASTFVADSEVTTITFTDLMPKPANTIASDLALDGVSVTDPRANLSGSLEGLRINDRLAVTCMNATTGQSVELPSLDIDCAKAGLEIAQGDVVRLTVKGAAQ